MKKNIILLVCLVVSSTSIFGQINWSDYREPDGSLPRLFVNPYFTSFSDSDRSRTELDFSANYTNRVVKERSILNLQNYGSLNLSANNKKDVGEKETNFSNILDINIGYRYYLNHRRGFFVDSALEFGRNAYSGDTYYQFAIPIKIGFGRLENISTLIQARRINSQLEKLELANQESLFALADVLRTQDYNRLLDSRMKNVDNFATYLGQLESLGYTLDTHYEIANAIDAFRYERPNIIYNGYQLSTGITTIKLNDDDLMYRLASEATFQKMIANEWHLLLTANFEQQLDEIKNYDLYFVSQISWLPSARTQIRASVDFLHSKQAPSISENHAFNKVNSSIAGEYFVAPNLVAFASIRISTLNYLDNYFNLEENTFINSRMGVRYFIL